jgi:hypothetical protein
LCVGNVGSEYDYWLLEGYECSAAGGFPSNPILSGSAPNRGHTRDVKRKERATNKESEELKKERNEELEK